MNFLCLRKPKFKIHKKLFFVSRVFSGIIHFNTRAQNVGINATGASPNAVAGLDVDFTNKGVLIPRVALSARNSNLPIGAGIVNSLLVYNTATSGTFPNNVYPAYTIGMVRPGNDLRMA